jgi:hypothetical protein
VYPALFLMNGGLATKAVVAFGWTEEAGIAKHEEQA